MKKNFTHLIAHFLSAKSYTVPAGVLFLFLATSLYVWANVGVTVTGGTAFPISADRAANSQFPNGGSYTGIGSIVITETNNNDFRSSGALLINAPAGWRFFNSGVQVDYALAPTETGQTNLSSGGAITFLNNNTTIQIPFSVNNNNKRDRITITGVQVQALDGANLPGTGNVVIGVGSSAVVTGLSTAVNTTVVSLSQQAGAASKLAFGQQPTNTNIYNAVAPAPSVLIKDQFNNTVTSGPGATSNISLAIGANPATPNQGTLAGTTTAAAVNGVAAFSGLNFNAAGTGYTLVASSGSLTAATSSSFNITSRTPILNAIASTVCILEGTNGFALTVTGTNFDRNAIGRINGLNRTTTFVSSTELRIALTAADVATAGTNQISVLNPAPNTVLESGFQPLVVNPILANAVFTPSQAVFCSGKSVLFTGPSTGFTNLGVQVQGGGATITASTANTVTLLFDAVPPASGNVTLFVTATNACGGVETRTIALPVSTTPPALITYNTPINFCDGGLVELNASVAPPGQPVYIYQWLVNGVAIDGATSSSYSADASGLYSVTVTAPGSLCSSTSTAVEVIESPLITQGPITGTLNYCQNAPASALNGNISGGGTGARRYLWEQSVTGTGSWSPATTVNSPNNEITYIPSTANSGTIYYRRTVEEEGGCTSVGEGVAVTVTPAITSNEVSGTQSICSGAPVAALTGTLVGGDAEDIRYLWQVSDNGTSNWSAAPTTAGPNNEASYTPPIRTIGVGTSPSPRYYRRIVTSGSCTSTSNNVTITTVPYPGATIEQGAVTYFCSPGSAALNATQNSQFTFVWFRVVEGGTDVEVVRGRNVRVSIEGNYYVEVTNSTGCKSTSAPIEVKPTIVGNNIISGTQEICYGTAPSTFDGEAADSDFGDISYQWQVSSTGSPTSFVDITGEIATEEDLTILTPLTATRWYRRIASEGSCENISDVVQVTVRPQLLLSSTLRPAAICSGAAFVYEPASATPGTSFSWERVAVDAIENPAASGNGAINEVLVNTSPLPVQVYYTYTLTTENECTNTQEVVVTVNPTPALSSTLTPAAICSGTAFTYTPSSATGSATYSWTRLEAQGINGPVTTTGTGAVNQVLTNNTTAPINVTYRYITRANNCSGNEQDVVVTVNPRPVLSSTLAPPAICSGATFSYTPVSETADASFTWTRAAVDGNPAASGDGAISEVLTNTTTAPINVTYVYTARLAGCSGATRNVVVRVNPSPVLSTPLTANVCSGNTFSYSPQSATAGAAFSWTRAASAGNPASSGDGAISEVLSNTGTEPITVTYVYTTTANDCPGTPQNLVVTIDPRPVLSSTLAPAAVCSNTAFTYTPTSATTDGTMFSWTRAAVTGISNAAVTTPVAGGVNETLINTTTAPIQVTYVYIASRNGCAGTPQNVVVTVNPRPVLSSTLTPAAICSGASFSYTPTSVTTGATYSWTRLAATNITSNGNATGTGAINQTLTNSGTAPVDVTYQYTVSANNCSGATTQNVVVRVNPTPRLSSTLTPPAVCGNTAFNYTATSATTGTQFSWSRAAVGGISNAAVSNVAGNVINETLVNTTTNAINVVYAITMTANGCTNTQNVTVSISANQPVAFTGTIANTSTFYTGQGAIALSAEPTGGVFSSPTAGAITLSGGVYSFNPCIAGVGTHSITYTRTSGSGTSACTNTVTKTVTVLQSTYRAVITADPFPFCRGNGGTTYTTAVYRDVQAGEIIYPYLVNENGQPVDQNNKLIETGPGNFPVPNLDYPFPANTPESIKNLAFRFFQPIVSPALAARQIDRALFNYQWGKNDEQNRKNDTYQTKDAGLSSQDYYEVEVRSSSLCSPVVLESNRMYSAVLEGYTVTLSATPNPICKGGPVTFTATLGSGFPWSVTNVQVNFILSRGNVLLHTANFSGTNTTTFTTNASAAVEGGFVNGDQVYATFTTDVLPYLPANNCLEAPLSNVLTINVQEPAAISADIASPAAVCVGGSTTLTANATGTGVLYQWYRNGAILNGATGRILTIENATAASAGNYYVIVRNPSGSACTTAPAQSNTVSLAVTALPVVQTLSAPNGTAYCQGNTTGVPIRLSSSQTTVSYQLQRNGVAIGSPITGTGSAIDFGNQLAGTFSVLATTISTSPTAAASCPQMMGNVVITIDPLPLTQRFDPATFCSLTAEGAEIIMQESQAKVTYRLFRGAEETPIATLIGNEDGSGLSFGTRPVGTYRIEGVYERVEDEEPTTSCAGNKVEVGSVTVTDSNNQSPASGDITAEWVAFKTWEVTAQPGTVADVDVPDDAIYTWFVKASGTNSFVEVPNQTSRTITIQNVETDTEVYAEVTVADVCREVQFVIDTKISPFPVEIIYLNAKKSGLDVSLEWATASEKVNTGFDVEVSQDGFNFKKVAFVPTKNGNSSVKQVYQYTDKENGKYGTRYYRLKQIDEDGTFEYFGPRAVTFGAVKQNILAYPNPFQSEVNLDIDAEEDTEVVISVVNSVGKLVYKQTVRVAKGMNAEKLQLDPKLPRGVYFITTQMNGQSNNFKLLKQ